MGVIAANNVQLSVNRGAGAVESAHGVNVPGGPGIGARVINIDIAHARTAHDIDLSVQSSPREEGAPGRHGAHGGPGVTRGIVSFHRLQIAGTAVVAAYRIDVPVNCDDNHARAWCGQRCFCLPGIAGRIVDFQPVRETGAVPTGHQIDLCVNCRRFGKVAHRRGGGDFGPSIIGRIVGVHAIRGRIASEDVDGSAYRRGRHTGAGLRHGHMRFPPALSCVSCGESAAGVGKARWRAGGFTQYTVAAGNPARRCRDLTGAVVKDDTCVRGGEAEVSANRVATVVDPAVLRSRHELR